MASADVPEGYSAIRELGVGRLGRAVLCRGSAGKPAVVRILGAVGSAAPTLEAELRSARAAADHPCAVRIARVWSDPTLGVCVEQEHCSGGALVVAAGTPAPVEAVAVGGIRLAAALAHSHRLGLLHGDVRPGNVLLDSDGNWRLANGGVGAALVRNGLEKAAPDPAYSPRELQGWETPAEPADVYSLGATLAAVLLGSTDAGEFVSSLAGEGTGLGALLIRTLAPNPADRPSLVEVDEVLRSLVAAPPVGLPTAPGLPRSIPNPPRPKMRLAVTEPEVFVRAGRRRSMAVAAAIAAVFLAGASAVAVANTGGDEASETVAGSAPLPEAAAGPTVAPTLSAASLTPSLSTVTHKVQPPPKKNGEPQKPTGREPAVLYVEWGTPTVPAELKGWNLVAIDPEGNRPNRSQLYDQFARPDESDRPGRTGFRYGYYLNSDVPLAWCIRVEAITGSGRYLSELKCPSAKSVREAVAYNANLAKKAQKQPSSAPKPKKPAREV